MKHLLLVLLLLAGVAQAEVGILVVDAEGVWSQENQERFALTQGGVVTDWKKIFKPEALHRLSYDERLQLLSRPERLLASDHVEDLFATGQVLVMEPARPRSVAATLYRLSPPTSQRFVRTADRDRKEARGDLVAEALGQGGVSNTPVLAHLQSRLYHLDQAEHLSEQAQLKSFDNQSLAARQGFAPCPICFPQSRRTALYDDLDRTLGQYISELIIRRYRLSEDQVAIARVNRVGRRLIRENRHVDQGYDFLVLDSEEMNAFAAPTGPFFVTAGLLSVLESDDELAGVLGHEIAHSERRHARRQYEKAQRNGLLGILVVVATGNPWARLGTDFFATMFSRGYSRNYEMESDRDGLLTAYGAGYEPSEFLLVQKKLRELEEQRGGPHGGWMRTHPGGEKRVRQIEEMLATLKPIEERIATIEKVDPGLARYLRADAQLAIEKPEEFQAFTNAYLRLRPAE